MQADHFLPTPCCLLLPTARWTSRRCSLYLPYISPISPLYLPYISQVDVSEMFHHMGVLPTFTLHSAGLCPGATPTHFWRVYSMKTSGMTCEITETFVADVLDRPPTAVKPAKRSSLDHNGF